MKPTVGFFDDLPWIVFWVLEKSLVERARGGLGVRGVGGSSSLGYEGVKKRRSLEGKVYFYDRGIWALFLGMNPLEEGVESREKET